MSLRVLLVIDKLGYYGDRVHGGGRVVLDWMRELLLRMDQWSIFVGSDRENASFQEPAE